MISSNESFAIYTAHQSTVNSNILRSLAVSLQCESDEAKV